MTDLSAIPTAEVIADACAAVADPWPRLTCGFHHIGYACGELEPEASALRELGYGDVASFVDPTQGVRGLFMEGPAGAPRIELLENLPGCRTLTPWLERGVRMYHLAEVVADLDHALLMARKRGARALAPPVAAPGFGGRRIVFTVARNGPMVELVELHRREAPHHRSLA